VRAARFDQTETNREENFRHLDLIEMVLRSRRAAPQYSRNANASP